MPFAVCGGGGGYVSLPLMSKKSYLAWRWGKKCLIDFERQTFFIFKEKPPNLVNFPET